MTVECVAGDWRGTPNGYSGRKCRCDECRSARREYDRQRHEANREADLERFRRYHEANREADLERCRRHYEANREADLERKRRHYETNREAYKEWWHLRRARQRNAFVETVVPQQVYERDNWTCHICDMAISKSSRNVYPKPYSPSLDHVIPLSKGGEHSYANCRAAHLRCNLKKGARC